MYLAIKAFMLGKVSDRDGLPMATRLERLIRIDALIRTGAYPNADRMCEILEVQPRTFFQDIKELREIFGLDIKFDRFKQGYFNANPNKRLLQRTINDDAAILIIIAAELLCQIGGPSFRGPLAPVIDLISLNHDMPVPGSAARSLSVASAPKPVSAGSLLATLRAIHQSKSLRVSADSPVSFVPQKIILEDAGWFVHGTVDDSAEVSTFALSKIQASQLNGQSEDC